MFAPFVVRFGFKIARLAFVLLLFRSQSRQSSLAANDARLARAQHNVRRLLATAGAEHQAAGSHVSQEC